MDLFTRTVTFQQYGNHVTYSSNCITVTSDSAHTFTIQVISGLV